VPEIVERLRVELSDRYAIDKEIGSGGMAHVLLAQDLKHRRQVAIKVLRPDIGSAVASERFLREIEIAAKLTHPHVLPVYDSGTAGGLLYYVMPFVEGESLRDRLKRDRRIPIQEALRITTEVADALAYAHERGVVHRDIKPENILVSAGHAVVSDFGIARAISVAAGDTLTATGIAIGTVHYMSPEQAVGDHNIDGRSDIYSLGCVLYEMLAGEPPFAAPTPQAVMARRFAEPSPTVSGLRPDVPPDVERALTTAMARDPDDRFATAEQFVTALSQASASVSAETMRAGRVPIARRAASRARLAVAGGTVAMIAVALVLWRGGTTQRSALSANRIAVLPFTVHGASQVSYLREGIVDLLSRNLEGAEDVQCIDPGTVTLAVRHDGASDAIDAGTGRKIVRKLGAGAFVLGSVNVSGRRMRIQAALYDASEDGATSARSSVEGDTAELLPLVDRLAAELLVARRPRATQSLIQTAALTTHSLPALKLFLNSEQDLRAGKLDSAIAGFQRAIAEDSTFTLAYYRLAIAAGWRERHVLSTEAVTMGLAVRGRLTERDQRLMTAYASFRRGAAGEAERQYRAILEDFPDDLEAEFQLGDVLFQYNPLRGRRRDEARPMHDRVLAQDPGFL
jgi:serine/threonine-protein kinase